MTKREVTPETTEVKGLLTSDPEFLRTGGPQHLKSTNMLERLDEEIERRTYVVRIFPNAESCLRLVRALTVGTHGNWLEAHRYLNMENLREHKNLALREAAEAPAAFSA